MKKRRAILQLKPSISSEEIKSFKLAIQEIGKFLPKLSKKTDQMRQLPGKKTERGWTEREEEEDFNHMKKKITEILCLVHFARDRDNIVTTDASETGLGTTLWQTQNDNTVPLWRSETEKLLFLG